MGPIVRRYLYINNIYRIDNINNIIIFTFTVILYINFYNNRNIILLRIRKPGNFRGKFVLTRNSFLNLIKYLLIIAISYFSSLLLTFFYLYYIITFYLYYIITIIIYKIRKGI